MQQSIIEVRIDPFLILACEHMPNETIYVEQNSPF